MMRRTLAAAFLRLQDRTSSLVTLNLRDKFKRNFPNSLK